MAHLLEVHASYLGMGKSSFIRNIDDVKILDGCTSLVETFPEYWYSYSPMLLSDNRTDELVKGLITLGHCAAKLEQLLPSTTTIVCSRSPIISAYQFVRHDMDENVRNNFLYFYKRRLQNMGVEKVTIVDYGDAIRNDEKFIKLGYERMIERDRKFEVNYFRTYKKYKQFFANCEAKKQPMVELLMGDSFFGYHSALMFDGFESTDRDRLVKSFLTPRE